MEDFNNPYQKMLDVKIFAQKSNRLISEIMQSQRQILAMIEEQNEKIAELTIAIEKFKEGNDK